MRKSLNYFKFGYIPNSNTDLISEIKFAKKFFNFVEITLRYNLRGYSRKYLRKIKSTIDGFEVLGHIHWEVDITKKESYKKILENIKIYKFLGAKIITIHLPICSYSHWKNSMIEALKILESACIFCQKNKIQLSVENNPKPPFDSITEFTLLFNINKKISMTLDIGHACRVSQKEFEKFLGNFSNKIKHVHLHYNKNESDHLFFPEKKKERLSYIIKKINQLKQKTMVTLEMFFVKEKQKIVHLNNRQRQELLIGQLKSIKAQSL